MFYNRELFLINGCKKTNFLIKGDPIMKKTFIIFLLSLLFLFSFNFCAMGGADQNRVQLAILLDTSGSMEGLIEQAKTQLWKIVNELSRASKRGESINLEVALFEYGKDSIPQDEGYLRMILPFTTDLDKISDELFKLRTNGGEEYCGEVIRSAVKNLNWSKDDENLKIIFIAGNEPFTQGEFHYKTSCYKAETKGIIVNTIFCGNYQEGISTKWKDGADLTNGRYMNIDHNQQIVHISAPQDRILIKLGIKLNTTYIGYGIRGKAKKEMQQEQDANAMSLDEAVMADRAIVKGSKQYKNSSWDLVDAESEGKVKVEELSENELPEEMKEMTVEERKRYLNEKVKERETIQKEINELNEARRIYVAEKMEEMGDNTLDAVMIKAIRAQAEAKNFKFN